MRHIVQTTRTAAAPGAAKLLLVCGVTQLGNAITMLLASGIYISGGLIGLILLIVIIVLVLR